MFISEESMKEGDQQTFLYNLNIEVSVIIKSINKDFINIAHS